MSGNRELNYSAKLDISDFRKSTTQALKEARELNKELAKGATLKTFDSKPLTEYQQGMLKIKQAQVDLARKKAEDAAAEKRLRLDQMALDKASSLAKMEALKAERAAIQAKAAIEKAAAQAARSLAQDNGSANYLAAQLRSIEALKTARLETERLRQETVRLSAAVEAAKAAAQASRAETERKRQTEIAARTALQQGRITQQQHNTTVAAGRAAQVAQNAAVAQGRVDAQNARTALAQLTLQQRQATIAANNQRNSQVALSGSYREAQQRLTELGNRIRSVQGGFDNASPAMQRKIREYNQLNAQLRQFDATMGNHQRNVGNYSGALKGAGNDLMGLVSGYLSAGAALQYILKSSMEFQRIKTPLTYILGSEGDAANKLDELKTLSKQLGIEFFTLASSYKSFAAASRASNFDLVQSEKIFTSVTKASAVLGLSTEQLQGAFTAIQQMISKGKVSAEELSGQLAERLPGAFAMSAQAMGKTEPEFRKLLETGQIMAQDMLPKLALLLDKKYGDKAAEGIKGLNAEWQRFVTSLQGTAGESSVLSTKIFEPILRGAKAVIDILNNSLRGSFTENFRYIFSLFNSTRRELLSLYELRDSNTNNKSALQGAKDRDLTGAGLGELKTYYTQVEQTFRKAAKDYETFKKGVADGSIKETTTANLASYARLVEGLAEQRNRIGVEVVKQKKQIQQAGKDMKDIVLTSVTDIRKEIARLSKLDGSAVIGSDIYNQIEALKAKLKKPKDTTEAEYKKAEREAEALGEKLTKLLSASSMASMTADQKEVESVKAKYAEMQKEADEFYSKGNGVKVKINGKNVSKSQVDGTIKAMQKAEEDAITARDKAESAKKEKEKLDALLAEFMSYADKRKAAQAKYEEDLVRLAKNPKERVVREEARRVELEADADAQVKNLEGYEQLFNGIDRLSDENAKKVIFNAQNMLDTLLLKGKISKELAAEIAEMIGNTTKELKQRLPDGIIHIARQIDEVANSVGDLDEAFKKILSTVSNVVGQVGNIKKGMEDFKTAKGSGDVLAQLGAGLGIFGAGLSIMSTVNNFLDRQTQADKDRADARAAELRQTNALTKALERQLEVAGKTYGTQKIKEYKKAIEDATKTIEESKKALSSKKALTLDDSELNELIEKVNNGERLSNWSWWGMTDKEKYKYAKKDLQDITTDVKELQKLLDAERLDANTAKIAQNYLNAIKSIEEAGNAVAEFVTGSTFDSLADNIVDMFKQGTTAAADFAGNFEDIMKNAIMNSFKTKLLTDQLQAFYKEFATFSESGGVLTKAEIDLLKGQYDKIIKDGQDKFAELGKITGMDLSGKSSGKGGSSLQGDIKSITTEQAGVLTGTMNGMRLAQLDGNRLLTEGNKVRFDAYGIAKSHFDVSVKIEQNTFRTANNTDALKDIKAGISSIDKKMDNNNNSLAAAGR
jgi:tape measure domain-containing protein